MDEWLAEIANENPVGSGDSGAAVTQTSAAAAEGGDEDNAAGPGGSTGEAP